MVLVSYDAMMLAYQLWCYDASISAMGRVARWPNQTASSPPESQTSRIFSVSFTTEFHFEALGSEFHIFRVGTRRSH